ncbi:TonB-dependent receptor domain-containing protein [Niveispirillum cyanobacteriorum]|nr:TonB-dependent receptor [Niveispirillum cyanobacteriorum]
MTFKLTALAGVSLCAIGFANCPSAMAQTSPTAAAPAVAMEELEEIIVTGSRVIRSGDNSPTPVTVVAIDDILATKPTTVFEALNELPVFSGSRGQTFNPAQPNRSNNNIAALNLRNIGPTRTLVLFDGMRVPATTTDGLVDTNMIPQLLLKRVDVVSGGASAVYGSDAVSGVVNFVTDSNFNGLKAQGQFGTSEKGDADAYDVGIAYGQEVLNDRGHIQFSYQYRKDDGLAYRTDRPLGDDRWTLQGQGIQTDPYYLVAGATIATHTFGGRINGGVLNGLRFAENGTLVPFVNGTATSNAAIQIGGDGSYHDASLKAGLEMHQAYGRFDYDLTDSIHGFVQATYSENTTSSGFQYSQLNNYTFSANNAFLNPAIRSQLAAANQTTFRMQRMLRDFDRLNNDNKATQYFINSGLEGDFGDNYSWKVGYSRAETKQYGRQNANIHLGRLAAALDAVVDPATGRTVCNVSLTNPSAYPGCVPLNLFGEGNADPAAIAYVMGQTSFEAVNAMDDVMFSVGGSPFSTWAGEVTVALSGEFRRNSLTYTASDEPTERASCTGIRFNCTAATLEWINSPIASIPGEVEETVGEGAIEANVPLLADLDFAKALNLNLAARHTVYETAGKADTWKVGGDWQVNDVLRFRGTISRDIRAPTLYDLFEPQSVARNTYLDLLTGLSVEADVIRGGNPDLVPEKALTKTLGFVVKPDNDFSIALDWFDIEITDAITAIQGNDQAVQRVCYASGGTSSACSFQVRPNGYSSTAASNVVTAWRQQMLNYAEQRTKGADLEVNYATDVNDRSLNLRLFGTYQPKMTYITPGFPTEEMAGVAYASGNKMAVPKWRFTATAVYEPIDDLTTTLSYRWRSSLKHAPAEYFNSPKIDAAGYVNLNLNYRIKVGEGQTADLFFNVQNLFDKEPEPGAFFGSNTAPGLYGGYVIGDDPVGRYFTSGVRYRF